MGPTKYLQTVSADIVNLEPGAHVVKVKAVDSQGRVGGYAWTFTVGERRYWTRASPASRGVARCSPVFPTGLPSLRRWATCVRSSLKTTRRRERIGWLSWQRPLKRKRRTKAEVKAIREATREEFAAGHPMTPRQVYYRLVSRDDVIQLNTVSAYDTLSVWLRDARLEGIISWVGRW